MGFKIPKSMKCKLNVEPDLQKRALKARSNWRRFSVWRAARSQPGLGSSHNNDNRQYLQASITTHERDMSCTYKSIYRGSCILKLFVYTCICELLVFLKSVNEWFFHDFLKIFILNFIKCPSSYNFGLNREIWSSNC